MTTIMQGVTYVAAILAAVVLFATESTAAGAPQEAAGAALALGIAIIPYCISSTMQRADLITHLRDRA
ncbi:hypothetical protein EV283_1036 [Sphingomonas sp. BK036]|uniref:hypothetical protein n=1 Tax=Sphingomonas sp. BK036 TaxID=2512122 RepID=UPI001029E588|nr:hypothetical protein [Sphingomonas sp. BK036]RZT56979.1 hypothetical protein EV283_1036 [Sphingomonas sp. BK036]